MRVPLTRTGQSAVDWLGGNIVEDVDAQDQSTWKKVGGGIFPDWFSSYIYG